jgi:hypothetical protein
VQAIACVTVVGVAAAAAKGLGGRAPSSAAPATQTATVAAAAPESATARAASRRAAPPPAGVTALAPTAPEGRSPLSARGAYAVRTGELVTVHFDVAKARTRRADRFEQIVRATLPQVYGPAADTLLAAVQEGTLVGGAHLTAELPARGIRLQHPAGSAVTLWPETRPGRDGPLVVAYRVTATP